MNIANKKKAVNIIIILLACIVLFLIGYLLVSPYYPLINYEFKNNLSSKSQPTDYTNPSIIKEVTIKTVKKELQMNSGNNEILNRLIINKIGVDIPIIKSESPYALELGAWLVSFGSTPDKTGNTIITGHRFKYLPPNNATFYLLDKLSPGDIISAYWDKKYYYYKVKELKIIAPDDFSVFNQTDNSTLTLYTCHPIFSQKNRLVVISELINK